MSPMGETRSLLRRAARIRLSVERMGGPAPRVVATACWQFPIHSQTFVYEELERLLRDGFALRLLYNEEAPRAELGGRFDTLWAARRNAWLDPDHTAADHAWFRARQPDRVASLLRRLSDASGMSLAAVEGHPHVRMGFSFSRMVNAYRPHYLHSYFFYEGSLFTLMAAELLDVPRGVSCYADHMVQDFPFKVVPLHLATADIVVATSGRIRDELLALHPEPSRDNVIVKPNGIDVARFPAVSRPDPAPGEPFRVVTVCRLEPKKGLLDLVEAAKRLVDDGMRLAVHVVGGADQDIVASRDFAAELGARIAELGLSGVVRLEGRRSQAEVLRFLHDGHAFVAPFVELEGGDKDGIPTALLEAMSTAMPVIATNAGSIAEVVRHGDNGMLVRQRDPEALASGISELARRPELRRALGASAARGVRASFDAAVRERELHVRIRRVLAERGAR